MKGMASFTTQEVSSHRDSTGSPWECHDHGQCGVTCKVNYATQLLSNQTITWWETVQLRRATET
jgi:hypothetical protein